MIAGFLFMLGAIGAVVFAGAILAFWRQSLLIALSLGVIILLGVGVLLVKQKIDADNEPLVTATTYEDAAIAADIAQPTATSVDTMNETATYEATSPNGTKYEVTAPIGATQEQVLAYAQKYAATAEHDARSSYPGKPVYGAEINAAVDAIMAEDEMVQTEGKPKSNSQIVAELAAQRARAQ